MKEPCRGSKKIGWIFFGYEKNLYLCSRFTNKLNTYKNAFKF